MIHSACDSCRKYQVLCGVQCAVCGVGVGVGGEWGLCVVFSERFRGQVDE